MGGPEFCHPVPCPVVSYIREDDSYLDTCHFTIIRSGELIVCYRYTYVSNVGVGVLIRCCFHSGHCSTSMCS